MYVLQSLGLATGEPLYAGEFLQDWDPDGNDGRGSFVWTPDAAYAKLFLTQMSALEEFRKVAERTPVRPDGEPNRPLTSFNVAVVPLLEVIGEVPLIKEVFGE